MKNFHMRRRDLFRVAAGAAAFSSMPFAGTANAAVDELRVLFPGGSWKEFFERSFANDFAKKENIKFNWRAGHRFSAIVIAQRRNPQWDLMHANQTDAMQLGTMGLLTEWKEDRIPNLKDVHESFRYPYPRRQGPHAIRPLREHEADHASHRFPGATCGIRNSPARSRFQTGAGSARNCSMP